jgi:hypothetical protein
MAMPAGTYELADGRSVEAGRTTIQNKAFVSVDLDGFTSTPVVFSQVSSDIDASPVVTRVRNISTNEFQVRLREEEAADGVHAPEEVGYIAIETGDDGGIRVDHTGDTVTHERTIIAMPEAGSDTFVFLAGMQSHDGGDTAALRYNNAERDISIFVEEEQSRNTEVKHTTEDVGWLSAEEGPTELFAYDGLLA